MAADIKLLPLPEKVEVDKHLPTGVRIYAYDATTLKNYARANVAHVTAAKDAEIDSLRTRLEDTVRDFTDKIEALETEVAAQRTRADAMASEAIKHETRYARLTEALRGIRAFHV